MSKANQINFHLYPTDNHRLGNLCGQCDEHLRQIEQQLQVKIHNRAHHFRIHGDETTTNLARQVITQLYTETGQDTLITPALVHLALCQAQANTTNNKTSITDSRSMTQINLHRHVPIKPHSPNQERYVKNIQSHDINFGIGPAGTGKTYLAVACAVAALENEQVSRILLVRPAVEAGEKLGFLPGDFAQKVDPYFRPLYDALYEMVGFDDVSRLIERHVIEIVPLAYMRGRTLNDSFIILDEGQNTTKEQMKMFLTRIGFNSKAVITGDITQTDLPKNTESGLKHCLEILKDVKGLSFNHFATSDIVRHPLVQGILQAYDQYEANHHK